MANDAFASGHILALNRFERDAVLAKIARLPSQPEDGEFCIWQGIFHAPEAPARAGYIITFGLSHKYFGESDQIGAFLSFWENFIADLPAYELFIALEQEFCYSYQPFGKFYFQWRSQSDKQGQNQKWVFQGSQPIDLDWLSRFEANLAEK
jgi:hypothetical protein